MKTLWFSGFKKILETLLFYEIPSVIAIVDKISLRYTTVKAKVFPVVMYGCESWTIKKAEHRRTDAFDLWRWKRLLRVPWTVRRSKQSI